MMKRATRPKIHARFFQFQIFADHGGDVQFLFDFSDCVHMWFKGKGQGAKENLK